MKAGWKTVKLGEILDKTENIDPTSFPEREYDYIDVSSVSNKSFSVEETQRIKGKDAPSRARKLVRTNDVLFATIRPTLQRIAIIPNHLDGQICSTGYFVLRPKEVISSRFIYYALMTDSFRSQMERLQKGASYPAVTDGDVRDQEIPLPPLAEQKRIVALLDEAFAGIDEATAKLSNEVKEANSILQSKFNQIFAQPQIEFDAIRDERNEATFAAKGRKATSRNIAGSLSLSVGKPSSPAKPGWRWVELSTLAQLESGHTPSRSKPEYWNGEIPWISIRDAKKAHGKVITETEECITKQGVENSSARILPANTVCLSRTASVGYCTITGRPMATSQDFVNWVIKGELHPDFLKFILLAEGDQLLRFASGSVHQTIYYPETKAFSICAPELKEQIVIARQLEDLKLTAGQLLQLLTTKKALIVSLKASILAEAFAGELTA